MDVEGAPQRRSSLRSAVAAGEDALAPTCCRRLFGGRRWRSPLACPASRLGGGSGDEHGGAGDDAAVAAVSRVMFDRHDADGSGQIDTAELRGLLADLGHNLSEAEHAQVLASLDKSNDGRISYEEFAEWWEFGLSLAAIGDREGASRSRQLREQARDELRRQSAVDERRGRGAARRGSCHGASQGGGARRGARHEKARGARPRDAAVAARAAPGDEGARRRGRPRRRCWTAEHVACMR